MTVQEVKSMLNSVRVKYREYILAQDKAAQFRDMISSPALRQSDTPQSEPGGNVTEQKYVKMLEYSENASEKFREYLLVRFDAERMISSLADLNEWEVLTRRYILGEKWENIAEKMHYSRRQITNIHGYALSKISLNFPFYP
jgi:hypothetical protein